MTINIKLGNSNQNSYVTVAMANTYFTNRRDDTDWNNLTATQKEQLLIQAARDLNNYNFIGEKCYESQGMAFPRKSTYDGFDHETVTGDCATPITATVFRSSNLYSSTYNKYPTNHWKYGTVHITSGTPVRDTRVIDESNAVNGSITLASPFSDTPTTNTNFKVFAPVDELVRNAQCEQALYILKQSSNNTLLYYANVGADSVKIGDVKVDFKDDIIAGTTNVSSMAKKMLSRWIRKGMRIGRS